MLQDKQLFVGNFNCTFGRNNDPMLDYFFDIVFPAFKEGEKISKDPSRKDFFVFENIMLTMQNGVFVIGGLIVKRTELEVKSNYDELGNLIPTDKKIPSDPYSYFMINLKNHRMTIVKNQKGSPTLKDFEKASKYLLLDYVNNYNQKLSSGEEKLPRPYVNVVSIPHSGTIKEELKEVSKIEYLTLKFFPKNRDVSHEDTFEYLGNMLERAGSKTGNTTINTPKNHDEVGKIIEETEALAKPTLRVHYNDGRKRTLKHNDFSETSHIQLDEEFSFSENLNVISGKVINQEGYNTLSEENKKLYDKYYSQFEEFYDQNR
ncbi:hypothetical protein [Oceanobacillus rekensis]|uniref:hypothetical protein n=1 Tax=Oceanobacillus rekensis TaxID=937927 RepID=UPI000B44C74E|nr:hypothetical protein [Oceanobacillus rekensis]